MRKRRVRMRTSSTVRQQVPRPARVAAQAPRPMHRHPRGRRRRHRQQPMTAPSSSTSKLRRQGLVVLMAMVMARKQLARPCATRLPTWPRLLTKQPCGAAGSRSGASREMMPRVPLTASRRRRRWRRTACMPRRRPRRRLTYVPPLPPGTGTPHPRPLVPSSHAPRLLPAGQSREGPGRPPAVSMPG